jgi:hypothetical protein
MRASLCQEIYYWANALSLILFRHVWAGDTNPAAHNGVRRLLQARQI